jgi:RimJ/RimL family protein N-acetyltransferase
VQYGNNPRIAAMLMDRWPAPLTVDAAEDFIRMSRAEEPEAKFAIASKGSFIGGIGVELKDDVYQGSAELGYWVAEPFWGQGIATAAVTEFTNWAMQHFQLRRVYAGVFENNRGSARVLEKAGYEFEGRQRQAIVKNGTVMDLLSFARTR